MTHHRVRDIRNVVFCGHGSAGKTSIIDQLLIKTGAIGRPASVDDGTSVCDFDDEEKHHKHSLEATLVTLDHGDKFFQILDTPGYPDFIGQTLAAMRAADTAAIVVNAIAGIEVNTRRVFREAGERQLGRIIVVNKMDDDNVDVPRLVQDLKQVFGIACVPFNVPVGSGRDFTGVVSTLVPPHDGTAALLNPEEIHQPLIEAIIENDDTVTERYFNGQMPSDEELRRLAPGAIAEGTLIPVVFCSAKTGVGLDDLLNAMDLVALAPCDVKREASTEEGEKRTLNCDPSAPFCGLVFKTRIDPFVQKLSFIRVFSGVIKKDSTVHAAGAGKPVKLHQLLRVQGGETTPADEFGPGEMFAVAKTEDLHTGTSVGDLVLPPIRFPRPMTGLAVTPKTRGDEGKLSNALHKLLEEDPTVHLDHDSQTKEMVLTGMSELHLNIIREKLKRRDKVEFEGREPKIPYRETIQTEASGSYRHKKQSGGRGQFGEVHIRMYPLPEGVDIDEFATKARFPSMRDKHYDPLRNFLWIDSIVGGTIPNNFLPAIEKGFNERMERGVIAGNKVQNVCVEVHYGKHHPVDSSEAAFKIAGSMAFRNVFQEAKPALLEPIVTMHITVPSEKLGDINSDMSSRRGRVHGMESAGGDWQMVTAEAPLSEVTNYGRALSSITGGQGSYTLDFSHYAIVPGNIQKDVIDKAVMHEEEDV